MILYQKVILGIFLNLVKLIQIFSIYIIKELKELKDKERRKKGVAFKSIRDISYQE